jgi:anti-sigma28 factor (negative regulator of flagellin synthesis)
MINKINSTYNINIINQTENIKTNKFIETKETKETNKLSKVEQIKRDIANGTYQIELDILSEKLADTLL